MDEKEKPRTTINEILHENDIIKRAFWEIVGAPMPEPMRSYEMMKRAVSGRAQILEEGVDMASLQYMEEKMARAVNTMKRNGAKRKYMSQPERDVYWEERAYSDYNLEGVDVEDKKWDAWCMVIGIPVRSRVRQMFQMLPEEKLAIQEWPFLTVASVMTGRLLVADLQILMEFVVWFGGGYPDTFVGILDRRFARACFVDAMRTCIRKQWADAPWPVDIQGISTANEKQFIPKFAAKFANTPIITLVPASFTEICEAARPDMFEHGDYLKDLS